MILRRAAWVLVCLGCVTCSKPPPNAPAPKPAESAAAEPAPDLSPVGAPADLVALGRVNKPRALVETFFGWAGFPLGISRLLPSAARELEPLIQWDAPIELAAALDRETTSKTAPPLIVVSFGLPSVDAARAFVESKGGRAERVAPGTYRVRIEDAECAIAPALGQSPARLVCSEAWEAVEPLLAYATRGLPRETIGTGDLAIQLLLDPVERRYKDQLQSLRVLAGLALRQIETDDPRLDRALSDIVYALADELGQIARELHGVTLSATLNTTSRTLDLESMVLLRGAESTWSQLIREGGKRATPAPEAFFKLPAEAHSGVYNVAGDRERLTKLTGYVRELVDAYLEREKLGTRLRDRVRSIFDVLPQAYAASAYVSGGRAPAKDGTPSELVAAKVGWHVGVIEQRMELLTQLMGDLTAALNDRELAQWLVKEHDVERAMLPRAKSSVVRVPSFAAAGTAYTLELPPKLAAELLSVSDEATKKESSDPAGAGADAKKAKPTKGAPLSLTIVLAPDGPQTWMAVALTQREAVERLAQAHAGSGATLAGVAGLAALQGVSSISGGFTSVESLAQLFSEAAAGRGLDLNAVLDKLPEHGRTPVLWWSTAVERGPDLVFGVRMQVPAAALGDAGALVIQTMVR